MKKLIQTIAAHKIPLLTAAFMAAVTFALYSPSIGYDFINYDDDLFVYDNPAVQRGLGWSGVEYAFTTYDIGTWAPLTWLSFEVDSTLLGTRASAYRTTNILLHGLGGAILFLALLSLFKRFWPSFLVAGIFLVHPLRTESIIWVTERKDVLFGFFWALGLLAYGRYGRQPSVGRWAVVFLCFVAGTMSKFMMVTFPCVLLLLDFWPLNRFGGDWKTLRARIWPLVLEKIPFVLTGVIFHEFAKQALEQADAFHTAHEPFAGKLLRVLDNYGFYLGKIFWPVPRAIFYPVLPVSIPWASLVAALLLTVTGIAIWQMWKRPWLLVGWFWFLGTLIPVIGFVTFSHFFVADRYAYIPSIGLTLAVALGLEYWLERFSGARPVKLALAAIILTACIVATHADMPRWQNSITLYENALRVGNHAVSYNNLAAAYNDRGDYDRTIAVCDKAVRLYPKNAGPFNNRGLAYQSKGDFVHAAADFTRAIELSPDKPEGYNNRGNVRLSRGDLDGAAEDFTAAIKISPLRVSAYNNRAVALKSKGLYDAAIADCTRAIQINPRYGDAYLNRGSIYAGKGEPARALADLDAAIRINPNRALYYNNRAATFFDLKKYDRAQADLEKCRQLGGTPHPGLVQALKELTHGVPGGW